MMNRLQTLHDAGQSIWLDYIDRAILHNGELSGRLERDALTGMTSNPTIFEKALAEGTEYDAQLARVTGRSAWELFELIETDDVRAACDIFRPIYEGTRGGDGYVSIEVSPGAAHDAATTIAEAHRLWRTVDRPNVMVKVPGTTEGARAVRQLISDGVNVNVTLLFSLEAYARIIDAYQGGITDRAAKGQPVDRVASVASFFVSRVDNEVDARLEALARKEPGRRATLDALKGRAAVANARLAYQLFRARFDDGAWDALSSRGAQLQRPLWASTSTKNPAYRDVLYVEELIGPDTVNTMPPATIEAFRDHGVTARTVDRDPREAREVIAALEANGISMRDVTDTLLIGGLASFQKSFDTLVAGLERKMSAMPDRGAGAAAHEARQSASAAQ